MSAHFPPPNPVDLLSQAREHVRPHLDRSQPVTYRLRALWAATTAAVACGAIDVVEAEFLDLARDTSLIADLGRHGEADARHVIRAAMLGTNPFQ